MVKLTLDTNKMPLTRLPRQRCRSVNNALARYPEARRRNLQLHTPIILAVWPQARLVQEEASTLTYGEVYEANCSRYHREADKPILFFKERVHGDQPADRRRTPPFPLLATVPELRHSLLQSVSLFDCAL